MSDKTKIRIGLVLINLLAKTWRIKSNLNEIERPCILAFWHGEMLPIWYFMSKYKPTALVSMSKDGEILCNILDSLGYELIRGSSSRGGKEALEQIVLAAKDKIFMITPDGPRGPRMQFKPGAVIAAARTGSPLLLCRSFISRGKVFEKAWDKFTLPAPFTKIELVFSDYISIPQDSTREQITELISVCETKINVISREL